MAWLVAGLGNPGDRYARTRHNLGAMVADELARVAGERFRKARFVPVEVAELTIDGERVWLARSLRYMNESGPSYASTAKKHDIAPDHLIAVHDEIDLPFGTLRIKIGGGTAGHNGLKDISARLGSHDYWRLRLGIGHPGDKNAVTDYVLQKPLPEERELIDAAIFRGIEALPLCLSGDMQGAMQALHRGAEPKPAPERKE